MRGIAIKQSYIAQSVLFITILSIMSLGLIGGCSDSNSIITYTALSENDFAEDSSLRARLDRGVIVTFLEAPSSEAPEKDTGEVGIDLIPLTYPKTTEQRFCWKDDDSEAKHFMVVTDSEGSVILTADANGDCVTEVIEPGDYSLSIHHDGSNENSLPVFLIPQTKESVQAGKKDGLAGRFKLAASNILKRMEAAITKDAQAKVIKNMDTLLSTKNCDFCSLINLDLRDAYLLDIDLSGADLTGADFTGATLEYANLSYAGLGTSRHVYAQLVDSHTGLIIGNVVTPVPVTLDGQAHTVTMDLADIANSDFTGADLTGVDFTGTTAFNTDFRGAIMVDTILYGVVLDFSDLSVAIWCDGSCICAEGSIGECVGCPSADTCTGP